MGLNVITPKGVSNFIEHVIKPVVDDDPEMAHESEDELYEAVLREVANGNPQAREMARTALKTKQLDYPRWCA